MAPSSHATVSFGKTFRGLVLELRGGEESVDQELPDVRVALVAAIE